jgi:hypothetical protein
MKKARAALRQERAARLQARSTATALSTDSVLTDYADDPVRFFDDFLRYRHGRELRRFKLWGRQERIAIAVAIARRVAVRSGHKVGKSKLAAAIAIWWACTRHAAVVMLTAPTERQVKKALWKEIRQFWANSPKLRQIMPEPQLAPETGSRWEDGRELFGFTAKNADAVSGPGGPEVLVVVDEGSGVPREVWEALQGVRAGGGKVLALGNPTQTSGWFFDAFNEKRAGWDLHHISSKETPNFVEGTTVLPGLATREFEEEIANDYGRDSPTYAVRVEGNFPANVANAVVGLGQIEAARELWQHMVEELVSPEGTTVDLGVDVARFGDDDSAVCGRIGLQLFSTAWFEKEHGITALVNGYDAVKVARMAVACLKVLPVNGRIVRIKIDCTGGYGEPVASELRAMQERGDLPIEVQIIELNFAASSSDSEKYPVLRDELWFGLRPFFKNGGAMYPDPKLESELMAATYSLDEKGRNKVEKKREMKKRLGRSPDRADAAILAVYEPNSGPAAGMPDDHDYQDQSRWEGMSGNGFG